MRSETQKMTRHPHITYDPNLTLPPQKTKTTPLYKTMTFVVGIRNYEKVLPIYSWKRRRLPFVCMIVLLRSNWMTVFSYPIRRGERPQHRFRCLDTTSPSDHYPRPIQKHRGTDTSSCSSSFRTTMWRRMSTTSPHPNMETTTKNDDNDNDNDNVGSQTRSLLYPQVIVPQDYQRTTTKTSQTCDFPNHPQKNSNNDWIHTAARNLKQHGVCVLVGGGTFQEEDKEEDHHHGEEEDNHNTNNKATTRQPPSSFLIDPSLCDRTNEAALSRLEELQYKIRNRGIDPTGRQDGPFRFREVVCRDEGGRRYDMPVHWWGSPPPPHKNHPHQSSSSSTTTTKLDLGTPLTTAQTKTLQEFHSTLDVVVQPVMNALWSSSQSSEEGSSSSNGNKEEDSSSSVAAAGFLINQPGSKSQGWHRDGPDEGYIDVFVPLVDLTDDLGPTRLLPGTHRLSDDDAWLLLEKKDGEDPQQLPHVVPLLQKGQLLLFDYRTFHKGQGNTSPHTTRALAYCVYTRPSSSSDIQNFPDALTLEYD